MLTTVNICGRHSIQSSCRSYVSESHQPVHSGGDRNPEEFYSFLKWKGLRTSPAHIVLVDDVITSGAHFKACQRLIHEHHPDIEIAGVFWAKVIWPEIEFDFEEIDPL